MQRHRENTRERLQRVQCDYPSRPLTFYIGRTRGNFTNELHKMGLRYSNKYGLFASKSHSCRMIGKMRGADRRFTLSSPPSGRPILGAYLFLRQGGESQKPNRNRSLRQLYRLPPLAIEKIARMGHPRFNSSSDFHKDRPDTGEQNLPRWIPLPPPKRRV